MVLSSSEFDSEVTVRILLMMIVIYMAECMQALVLRDLQYNWLNHDPAFQLTHWPLGDFNKLLDK